MDSRSRMKWIVVAAVIARTSLAAAATPPLVLFNANIYTVDDAHPKAEAVISANGKITYVGTTPEALKRAPRDAQRIDLHGQTVFPGLTDAHAHLLGIGNRELSFDLQGTPSLDELKRRLAARAKQNPTAPWIIGRGWIESRWNPAVFPSRADLDAMVSDRPVVLTRADGHALVANSVALQRAGIDRDTANPAGGEILKDKSGEPTGMLVDNAMDLIRKLVPPATDAERMKALEAGAAKYTSLGWTQLHNAGTPWSETELLCKLYQSGRITLRVYNAINGAGPDSGPEANRSDADRLLQRGASIDGCGGRLTVRTIKLYIDGALGSRGAALLEPYSDSPSSRGLFVNEPDALYPILTQALERGIQVETHAIGDRGNRVMLDLYEKAFNAVPESRRAVAKPRWRIEHAQVISPIDIPRFAKLGVIASMQPSHAIGDLYFAPARLGPDRLKGAYAWKSLLDSGATVVAGSDAPVEIGDPRIEFYAAVARRSLDGHANDDWHLEERVSREQALRMLTLWPAYAAFQEKERGSIEVGKQADFTVLSSDLMRVPEGEIMKARVMLTVIGGQVVYGAH
jgi:predicted amidohydrolase YtcJ